MFDTLTRMGASAAEDYEIEKSLRFNSGDNTRLTRTPSSSADGQKQTYSFWCKRSLINQDRFIIVAWNGSNTDRIGWQADNQFFIEFKDGGSTEAEWHSTRLITDTSAWYHFVVAIDTTLATEADRMKAYINGERITDWATNDPVSQNYNLDAFGQSGKYHAIGAYTNSGSTTHKHFNGYIADFHFIDGAQKAATDFGKTDPTTGQWIPIEYKGTYGSEGWYLNFSDNSNTTSGTLGADSSGNSNDWTPENFSVATDDEIACDSFSDTPTNNWCIMNTNNNPNGATVANGGLAVNLVYPHSDNGVYATFGVTSGKWYWEAKCTSAGNRGQVGVTDAGHKSGSNSGYNYSVATRHTGQTDDTSGTSNSNLDAVIDSGNWVTFCFDADNGQIWYSREAAPNISGTANVTGLTLGAGRVWKPHIRETGNPVSNFTFNFGASAAGFKYGPPNNDYKPLNAANLPEPTIKDGTKYFNPVLYTGNGSDGRAVTGVGFQPNLVWIANRDRATYKPFYDSVRGATKMLRTNTEDEEGTFSTVLQSFDSDGFTVGTDSAHNYNGEDIVSWNWKESASAGFDIVSYTGTGSAQTVSHSLGVAPEMMIIKNRDSAYHWAVYHRNLTDAAENHLTLSDTDGAAGGNTWWNDTAPTSSVFTVLSANETNKSSDDYIAYLFASVDGYSKVGSFIGNGNDNGSFIYTGFKTAWVMTKRSVGGSSNWNIFDKKRPGHNVTNDRLFANITNAETDGSPTDNQVDLLSNGFKMRGNNADTNASGSTYVYIAFAETPFKYANAE